MSNVKTGDAFAAIISRYASHGAEEIWHGSYAEGGLRTALSVGVDSGKLTIIRAFGVEQSPSPHVSVDASTTFKKMLDLARGDVDEMNNVLMGDHEQKRFEELAGGLSTQVGGHVLPVFAYHVGEEQYVFVALAGGIAQNDEVLIVQVDGNAAEPSIEARVSADRISGEAFSRRPG